MTRSLKNEDRLTEYLLGLMSEEEQVELEEMYLFDDERNQELQAAERDLMDRYLDGSLSEMEQKRFESFFLCSPGRRDKLQFAKALKAYGASLNATEKNDGTDKLPRFPFIASLFTRPYAAMLALVVLTGLLGLGVWRVAVYRSAEEQAMLALTKAYQGGRLFESRIYGLDYTPMAQTRGQGNQNTDTFNFNYAESIALKDVDEHPGASSFHTLGRVYMAGQKFSEALQWLRKAVEANPKDAGIHSDLGAVLLEMARQNPNPEQKAEEMARSFDHLSKALEWDKELLAARFNLALWHEANHLLEAAEITWQTYLQKDSSSGWADEARKQLKRLQEKKGSSYQNKVQQDFDNFVAAATDGDEVTVWKIFSRSRQLGGNTIIRRLIQEYLQYAEEDKAAEADTRLRFIAMAGKLELDRVGDHFTADLAAYYRNTTAAQRKLLQKAVGLFKPAADFLNKAEYRKAAELYTQAERFYMQAGNRCEAATAQAWIGACALRVPDTKQALAIFERLEALGSEHTYKLLRAQALLNIADAQASGRDFSKSQDNADKARVIYESIEDVSGALKSLQAPVVMNQQFSEFYKSTGFALQGLDIAASFSPEAREIWPFYQLIAFNLNMLNFPAVALEFQKTALHLALGADLPALKSRSYAQLALIYQKLGKSKQALENGELALAQADTIKDEKGRANMAANSMLNLAHLYREMGDFEQALTYYNQAIELHKQLNLQIYAADAHRGKLLSLIGLKDYGGIGAEIKTAISLLEKDRPKILDDSNRNSYFDHAQSIYDLAIDYTYSHLQDTRTAFTYSEASHARSLLDMVYAGGNVVTNQKAPDVRISQVTRPLEVTEIQKHLPRQSQILQYAVLENKVITWVISGDSIESAEQAIPLAELTERINGFLQAIAQPSTNDSREVTDRGKSLYELLIKPVKANLKTDGLVFIVPDKILNYLPFGAMICPQSGKYFVEEYLFELAPSSSLMLRCCEQAQEKANIRSEQVLAIGNPTFDRARFSLLADLPTAASEAETVARLYDATHTLTGQKASAQIVKRLMPDADVIHFAGHYVADRRDPMLSGLLLAKEMAGNDGDDKANGVLTAADVYDMRLHRTRLVVLSACGTGVERYYKGEGAIGMARPFIKAGVPVVVASLWPVKSEPTSQLMIAFHRHRKRDFLSAARALRQAQLDMLARPEPDMRNPHTWAAFVTIGGFAEF
jgi:CHAT domain-containing protein